MLVFMLFLALDCVFMLPLDSDSDSETVEWDSDFYIIINDGVLVYSQVSLL
jgi:hypothetical protein